MASEMFPLRSEIVEEAKRRSVMHKTDIQTFVSACVNHFAFGDRKEIQKVLHEYKKEVGER